MKKLSIPQKLNDLGLEAYRRANMGALDIVDVITGITVCTISGDEQSKNRHSVDDMWKLIEQRLNESRPTDTTPQISGTEIEAN